MKDINKVYETCSKKLADIGIQHGNIKDVSINKRAKRRWGTCKRIGNIYSIEISSILLDDDVSDEATETTMIHELLHSCKGCFNHGNEWKRLANKVNKAYGYNVKRVTTSDEKGIAPEVVGKKHKIVCQKCGLVAWRMRDSKLTRHPELFRCRCGGNLVKEY